MNAFEKAYVRAARTTGKNPRELKAMGEQVFATMLHHAIKANGQTVLTVIRICEGRIDLEVGTAGVRPRREKPGHSAG